MAKQSPNNPKRSRRQQRLATQQRATRLKQLRYGGLTAIILLTLTGLYFWRSTRTLPAAEASATLGPNRDGSATAPIQIIEYGDFGCHACRAWHNAGVKAQLKEQFGTQVAFEFRHFPVITTASPKAAEAGQCAAEQDAFWPFHDYIYEQTPEGALSTSQLKQYAAALNLEPDQFASCLDSGKYRELVNSHWQSALEAGARGTPTFLINGHAVSPQPQAMASTIQQLLGN